MMTFFFAFLWSHDQNPGLNNRAANTHRPFGRREGAMAQFGYIRILQKDLSAQASIHNHLDLERHHIRRPDFKQNRSIASYRGHFEAY